MKIGILVGGISSEKEVSIASGKSIEFACLALGHKVQMLDPKDDIENIKSSIMETDLVFKDTVSDLEKKIRLSLNEK